MEQKGTITPQQKDKLLTDAAPRSLYVQRKLLNAADLIKWAKGQGFETTLPAGDLHVTVCYSREPLDWMKVDDSGSWYEDDKGRLRVKPGGARVVEQFAGDKVATVLLFSSSPISWRHEAFMGPVPATTSTTISRTSRSPTRRSRSRSVQGRAVSRRTALRAGNLAGDRRGLGERPRRG
jgi:hypothetical protein